MHYNTTEYIHRWWNFQFALFSLRLLSQALIYISKLWNAKLKIIWQMYGTLLRFQDKQKHFTLIRPNWISDCVIVILC